MKTRSILSICISALLLQFCKGQPPNWQTSRNWKVYSTVGQKTFSYSIDTLQYIKSKNLNADSVKYFVDRATLVPKERTPMWMGNYLSSYEDATGKVRKVEISMYAGFFYDESSDLYYIVPAKLKNAWLNFISDNVMPLKAIP